MAIKIDKKIPIPTSRKPGTELRYPFRKMQVGHSFFVPGKTPHEIGNMTNYYRVRLGHIYTKRTRIEKCGGKMVKGVRVWRIK